MTKLARRFLGIGVVCIAAGAMGCGTNPESSDDIDKSTGALDTFLGCPAFYPTTALTFDTGTSQCSTSGDWDHTGIISPRAFYTSDDGHYFAGECGLDLGNHHYVVGVSARTSVARAHSMKCETNAHNVGPASSRHYLSRTNAQGGHIDDRGFITYDWDPGHTKAECGFHEVVTGIAQLESNEIDAISCNSASVGTGVSPATCNVLKFDFQGDHCLRGCSGSGDWAQGYFKNMCNFGQYVRGVSKTTAPNSIGEIHAILCCNWN